MDGTKFTISWLHAFLVLTGLVYLLLGVFSGHFDHHIWPRLERNWLPAVLARYEDHCSIEDFFRRQRAERWSALWDFTKNLPNEYNFHCIPVAIVTGFTHVTSYHLLSFLLTIFGAISVCKNHSFLYLFCANLSLLSIFWDYFVLDLRNSFDTWLWENNHEKESKFDHTTAQLSRQISSSWSSNNSGSSNPAVLTTGIFCGWG